MTGSGSSVGKNKIKVRWQKLSHGNVQGDDVNSLIILYNKYVLFLKVFFPRNDVI